MKIKTFITLALLALTTLTPSQAQDNASKTSTPGTVSTRGNMVIDNTLLDGFTVFYPTNIEATVASYGNMPIVVYGNGGCSHDSGYYVPMFESFVDNGYLVIAVGERKDAQPKATENHEGAPNFANIGLDDNLLDAVDWACKTNATPGSKFYHLLDCFKIALSGHSCGGAQAMACSYDPRITTTIMMNSGMGNMQMAGADTQSLGNLHAPILYLIGGPEDIAYGNAGIDYERITNVPVVMANFPVGHGGTYGDANGGVLGDVALQWLNWKMRGNPDASKIFVDETCRTVKYPTCDYKSKGI